MTYRSHLLRAVLVLLAACAESKGMTPPPALSLLQVLPASKRVEVGETFALGAQRVQGKTAENVTAMASIRSDDETVLRVSGALAEALSPGTARIIVEHEGLTGMAQVIVSAAVSAVELDVGDLALATGTSLPLGAVLFAGDEKRPFDTGSWGSLDPAIASVDEQGIVTGGSAGVATITVSRDGIGASTQVRVADLALASLQLTAAPGAQLPAAESGRLSVAGTFAGAVTPHTQDVTDLFTLSVGEDSAELVTLSGSQVTATAAGTATVLATGKPGTLAAGMSAELALELIAKERLLALSVEPPEQVALDMAPLALRVTGDYGDGLLLATTPDSLTAEPASALSIDQESGTLAPLEAAEVTLTAKLSVAGVTPEEQRDLEATAALSILDAPLSALSISAAQASLAPGAVLQLTATAAYGPSLSQDATELARWISDDPRIAVVSNVRAGRVTALSAGVVSLRALYRGQVAMLQLSVSAP
jgi:hypothetical protein